MIQLLIPVSFLSHLIPGVFELKEYLRMGYLYGLLDDSGSDMGEQPRWIRDGATRVERGRDWKRRELV
jgi:hypothetical protein